MKYIDAEKLIAEIERRIKLIPLNFVEVGPHPSAEAMNQKLRNGLERQLNSIKEFIASLQQEQPLTIEKVVEQCKKFGGNPEIIYQEQPEVDFVGQ